MPTGGHCDRRARVEEGLAAIASYPAVIKADGLAAGKGVVIAADEARGRARRSWRCSRSGASATHAGRWSRSSSTGDELSRARAVRRRARAAARRRRRTTSASATATPAPTPAAWARSRRSPEIHDPAARGDRRDRPPAGARRAARPRHAVPRRPLRRAHADRRRAARARVQRPLRRPRDAGRAAAPALATCSTC